MYFEDEGTRFSLEGTLLNVDLEWWRVRLGASMITGEPFSAFNPRVGFTVYDRPVNYWGPLWGKLPEVFVQLGTMSYIDHSAPYYDYYFAEAVEQLEGLSIESLDPIGFAGFLQTYAAALEETGAAELAGAVRDRALELRSQNSDKEAQFVPVEYRDLCKE